MRSRRCITNLGLIERMENEGDCARAFRSGTRWESVAVEVACWIAFGLGQSDTEMRISAGCELQLRNQVSSFHSMNPTYLPSLFGLRSLVAESQNDPFQ